MKIDSTKKFLFAVIGIFVGLLLPEIVDFLVSLFR